MLPLSSHSPNRADVCKDMMKMYAAGGMGGMDPNMFAADQTLTLKCKQRSGKNICSNTKIPNIPACCRTAL